MENKINVKKTEKKLKKETKTKKENFQPINESKNSATPETPTQSNVEAIQETTNQQNNENSQTMTTEENSEEKDIETDAVKSIQKLKTLADFGPVRVRLGLCCINNLLRNQKEPIFSSRTLTVNTYKTKGSSSATERALKNVLDIAKMIKWNKAHHIECFRLSSEIFPQYTNHKHIDEKDRYTLEFAREELVKAGKFAMENGQRLTFHPGQFNVVGTPRPEVFESTIRELKMHADIFDMMGMNQNSILVVHGGGTYGDKEATIERWISNFKLLPDNVKARLVLENDEKNFSVVDCLKVSKAINIPVVFDNHHFNCYKKLHPDEKFHNISTYIGPVLETWLKRGIRPKFHLSEQNNDKHTGAHSDYIKTFPDYYLEIPKKYGVGVDVMVEAKAKEAAILDLYKKYKNDFLGHLDPKEISDDMFKYDKESQSAIECSKCSLDTLI